MNCILLALCSVLLFLFCLIDLTRKFQFESASFTDAKEYICVVFQSFMAYCTQPRDKAHHTRQSATRGGKSDDQASTNVRRPSSWNYVKQFYQCQKCNKTFEDMSSLNRHVYRQHEQASKTERCSYCGRAFLHHSSLLRHIKAHQGIYKHKCDICQQGFAEKFQLDAHVAAKHGSGDFLFTCPLCNMGFNYKGNMTAHVKKVHSDHPT